MPLPISSRKGPSRFGRNYRYTRIGVSAGIFIVFFAGLAQIHPWARDLAAFLAAGQLIPVILRSLGAASFSALAALLFLGAMGLVFGRLYCSSLCPLGTLQDIFRRAGEGAAHIFSRKSKKGFRFHPEPVRIRFSLLAAGIVGLLIGSPAVFGLLDPYSLFGRSIHDLAAPLGVRAAAILVHPLKNFGVYLSPPESLFNPPLFFIGLGILSALFAVSVLRARLFCNLICPAGSLLRLLARRPYFSIRIDQETCTACGACEGICPAECIDSKAGRIDQGRCVRCGDCLVVCPVDSITFGAPPLRSASLRSARTGPRKDRTPGGLSRRKFFHTLGTGIGMAVPAMARPGKLSSQETGKTASPALFFPRPLETPVQIEGRTRTDLDPAVPPGSGGAKRFGSLCTACHLCVGRCPTRVLRPALFSRGLGGVLQPVMDYETGFCEYDCNLCGRVCPTGAIRPLDMRTKQKTQIGRAHLVKERCVVYTKETACGACAEVCPTHAVHMVPYLPRLNQPETDQTLCIGCGNCQFACPVIGTKAILTEGRGDHIIVDDRKDRPPKGKAVPDETPEGPSGRHEPSGEAPRGPEPARKNEFPF